jgi:hypothetical protein
MRNDSLSAWTVDKAARDGVIQGKLVHIKLQPPSIDATNRNQKHTSLTIQEVQELYIRILCLALRRNRGVLVLHAIERRQIQVGELVKVEKFGISEQRQLFIKVDSVLLLLLLLQSLVVRRGNSVQIIEVLGEVWRTAPTVVGHYEDQSTRLDDIL